jgi:hypothetical protein
LICQSWLHPVPDWQQEALEYRINLSSMITPCPKLTTRSSSISYEFVQAWLHPVPNWQEPLVYRMNLSSMITPCPKPTTRTSSISYEFVKHDYILSQTDNKNLYNIMLICQARLHPVPNWQQEALEYRINLSSMITLCPKLSTRSSRISC